MAGSRALGPGRRSGAFPGAPPSPEDGLSLEVLQQALRTLQTASQLSPAARQRGVQALERACARLRARAERLTPSPAPWMAAQPHRNEARPGRL